jgi:hypothetical protein
MIMEYTPSAKIIEGASEESILIILNCPLNFTPKFQDVWSNAKYKICADGGANRLFDMFSEELRPRYVGIFSPCGIWKLISRSRPQMN